MSYSPKIKNIPELIQDLQMILNEEIQLNEVKEKMDTLDYKHDSSDGFEDILDTIRPFIKSLSKVSTLKNHPLAKNKLEELIKGLEREISLEELENIKLWNKK